jgi:hypothetical protein
VAPSVSIWKPDVRQFLNGMLAACPAQSNERAFGFFDAPSRPQRQFSANSFARPVRRVCQVTSADGAGAGDRLVSAALLAVASAE